MSRLRTRKHIRPRSLTADVSAHGTGSAESRQSCSYQVSRAETHSPSFQDLVATDTDRSGSPPMWTPLRDVVALKEDDGSYYRDENSARSPHHPMEPTVRVYLETSEASERGLVDVVACGSTLGSLMRFVRSAGKPCRFWTEIVGGTMFFVRKERSPQELIEDVRVTGTRFPKRTRPGARTSKAPSRTSVFSGTTLQEKSFSYASKVMDFSPSSPSTHTRCPSRVPLRTAALPREILWSRPSPA